MKDVNIAEVLGAVPDLSAIAGTATSGRFKGQAFQIEWKGLWQTSRPADYVDLARVQKENIDIETPIGTITLEKSLPTFSDSATGVIKGVAVAVVLRRSPTPTDRQITYRTYVRADANVLSHVLFPDAIRDPTTGSQARALLPLNVKDGPLDIYFVKEGPFIVFEASATSLTYDRFRALSGSARMLFEYLTAVPCDTDTLDVICSDGGKDVHEVRGHRGREAPRHYYRPIPAGFAEWMPARKQLSLKTNGPLEPNVVSQCLQKLADETGLVTPIAYLRRFPDAPVDMRGAFLSVALESLTDHLEKRGMLDTVKPLDDEKWLPLRAQIRQAIEDAAAAGTWTKDQKSILKARADNLNNPTNADKLKRPFDVLNVSVSDDERKAITRRNDFLHEGRITDPESADPDAWREAYQVEMRIFTAINKLLLKYLGYAGPVIDWGSQPFDSANHTYVML